MADEEIRISISVEDEQAIQNVEELRQTMETFKGFAKNFAKETGDTLEVAFSGLRKVSLKNLEKELEGLKDKLKDFKKDKDLLGIKETEAQITQVTKKMQLLKEASVKGLSESKKEAREYTRVLQNLSKIQLGKTTKEIKEQERALKSVKETSKTATNDISSGMRRAETATGRFTDRLGGLGNVGRFVFGTVLGITAISALRNIIRFVGDATEKFIDFRRSVFVLEVSVRALQRAGFDTTIEAWIDVIDDFKKRFPIFSYQEIVSAVDVAVLKLREYKFTQEEIIKVLETSALLARGFGKDFGEMSERITGAITRGWFEALQSMGIPLSRTRIMTEALNQEIEQSFFTMSEAERAHLAYTILLEEVGLITEDLANITDESFDRIKIAEAELADATMEFGQTWESTFVAIKEAQAGAFKELTMFGKWWDTAEKRFNIFVSKMLIGVNQLILGMDDLAESIGFDRMPDEQYKQLEKNIAHLQSNIALETSRITDDVDGLIESLRTLDNIDPVIEIQTTVGDTGLTPEEYQEIVDLVQDMNEEITEIEEDAAQKRVDINDDYLQDIEDLHEKSLRRRLDLIRDFDQKLADIGTKEAQKLADEEVGFVNRVADAERDAIFRREDAERKFREREISSERKFQEKMRQLRENFLLNLEDAVRERDARQIVRLTRQFNLRRTQMLREGELGKGERNDAFKEELRQIERQRQERLRQLAIEHERRSQSIALQAERERAQADLDFERREADEDQRAEQEAIDREDRRDEQFADLEKDLQRRADKITEKLIEQGDLTEKQLSFVGELYASTYGLNGTVDQALINYQQRLLQTEALLQRLKLLQLFGTLPGGSPAGRVESEYDFAGEQAEGGAIVARKPTVAVFGEAGAELATFTPLNKLGAGGDAAKVNPMPMGNMSRDGRIRLEMLLSPDLEARIIDNTLGEIANVNVSIERARK